MLIMSTCLLYHHILHKKSGFATCAFCFANMHESRKLNLVTPEKSCDFSYVIKNGARITPAPKLHFHAVIYRICTPLSKAFSCI